MKEGITDTPKIRYYQSFSAYQHPIQPHREIDFSQSQQLSTYYEAKYDQLGRLIEFTKKLRAKGWLTIFTEKYNYFESGNLQRRTLIIPDQSDQVWEFTESRLPWSDYFESMCNRWFRRSKQADRPTQARLALLLHEQFTQLEGEVFESAIGVPRDNVWANNVTQKLLERTRSLIQEIEPNSNVRISAIASGSNGEIVLKGFDEPEPNLYGVVTSWQESHPETSEGEPITLLANRDLNQEAKNWAKGSNIGSITFAPIRAVDIESLSTAAILFLLTGASLSSDKICLVNSIFRRFLLLIQSVLEMARTQHASNQDSE